MLRRLRDLDLPLVLCLAVAPIQWITLYEIAGFTLEPFHLPILLVILLTFGSARYAQGLSRFLNANAQWLLPFIAYLLLLFVSLAYSSHPGGASVIARQLLFSSLCVAVATRVAANRSIAESLYFGAGLGLCVYYLVLFVSANRIGISVIEEHYEFLLSGSFEELAYGFFRPVFNAFQDGGHEFHASLRNNVSSALLVLFVVFRIAAPAVSGNHVGRWLSPVVSMMLLLSMIIVLSRSVVASWILSALIVLLMTRKKQGAFLALASAGIAIVGVSVGIAYMDSPLVSGLFDRLVTDTESYSVRLRDYEFAMQLIDEHPFLGVGYYRLMYGEYQQSHNLFLAAWAQAGVFAFLFSILFVVGFCAIWFRALTRCVTVPDSWRLGCDRRWLMALPAMAMFRLWSSGDGGNLNFSGWLSLGAFLGLLAQNRLAPSRQTAATTLPPRHAASSA